jgi:hypothetical protein
MGEVTENRGHLWGPQPVHRSIGDCPPQSMVHAIPLPLAEGGPERVGPGSSQRARMAGTGRTKPYGAIWRTRASACEHTPVCLPRPISKRLGPIPGPSGAGVTWMMTTQPSAEQDRHRYRHTGYSPENHSQTQYRGGDCKTDVLAHVVPPIGG